MVLNNLFQSYEYFALFSTHMLCFTFCLCNFLLSYLPLPFFQWELIPCFQLKKLARAVREELFLGPFLPFLED